MFLSSFLQAPIKLPIHAVLTMALGLCTGFTGFMGLPVAASDRAPATQQLDPHTAAECSPLLDQPPARRAVPLVRAQLLAQGMALVVQACPFVRVAAGDMRQVMDVRVVVVNSDVAADFVRGPLADDEAVDMGGVHFDLPDPASGFMQVDAEDVSPDVLFNRQWLSRLMQHRGLQAVAGHWWAFVPVARRP